MIRQRMSLSNLRSVGQGPPTQTMEIELKSGGVHRCDGVPPAVHAGLMGASAHGSYFHQSIKGAPQVGRD